MNITSPSSPVHRAYALLVVWASKLQSPLLLAVRLYWGWQFMTRGWAKLTHHSDIAEYFMSLQIPLPGLNAWLAGATECFGGLLLLLGLASRLTALPLIFTMIVAYLTAEQEAVQAIFSDPDKFVSATPFLYMFACVIVLVFGPGIFSVDHLLARRLGPVRANLP